MIKQALINQYSKVNNKVFIINFQSFKKTKQKILFHFFFEEMTVKKIATIDIKKKSYSNLMCVLFCFCHGY